MITTRAPRTEAQPRTEATLALRLDYVHCCECAWILQLGLEAFHGVDTADVDCDTGAVHVTFRPSEVTRSEIVRAIRSTGYDVLANAG